MKRCIKCKKVKLLFEYYKDSYSKDGHGSRCKECWKVYREQHVAYRKQYNVERRDHRLAHNAKNRAKILRQAKEWNKANHERMLRQQHLYFHSPRGKIILKRGQHKRRAYLASCEINDLTTPQIRALLSSASVCAICGRPFDNNERKKTIDHIVPLSKKGNNTLSNLQIACKKCNLKKSNKLNYANIT